MGEFDEFVPIDGLDRLFLGVDRERRLGISQSPPTRLQAVLSEEVRDRADKRRSARSTSTRASRDGARSTSSSPATGARRNRFDRFDRRDRRYSSRRSSVFRGDYYRPSYSSSSSPMADTYDGGQDRRRAGKRRRDDDDYHYTPRDDRRGAQRRRRDGSHPPRREYEEPARSKLRRMLLNIASSAQLPETESIEIAKVLHKHYDDEDARGEFFDVLVALVVEQPFKIPFVAAVVLYGNQIKGDIAVEATKRVGDRLQQALSAGEWKEFKLLLRFFACLQPLFEEDGIFTLLGQLFDTVVDLQSANENDVVGIELVKIILLTIPYALVSGGSRFHDKAKDLLNSTAIVAGNVLPMESLIHSYVAESDEKVIGYHSVIGLLQNQLTVEAENGWQLSCIPKFDIDAIRKQDPEGDLWQGQPTYVFPAFTIPSPVNPGPKPLFPEAYFSLFADQEMGTVPKTTDIAASIIRDAIVDTIELLDFNREAVAKFLIELDSYWALQTFAYRGIAFDVFRETVGDEVRYKSEDMVIDAIFSMLFKLPTPERKLVYYHSVITQCCKIAPAAIAPSLGRAIRTVYKSIGALDLELAYRFLDWFSHHLSNFEFRWRWAEWVPDLELEDLQPQKAFILATIDKEIRLSFAKRVRQTLPEPMAALVADVNSDSSPEFKFNDPTTPYSSEGIAIIKQIKEKASFDDMQATFDRIHSQAQSEGITDVLVPSTDVFVTAICRAGAKSLSHVFSCIERTKTRLLDIAQQSEAARRQIVASVTEYWKDSRGTSVRIIDVLINYAILAPMTVVQWVFQDYIGAGEGLSESWIFEIVSNTVAKVCNRNRQIATARAQKNLPQEQLEMVQATLRTEREAAREIFRYIEDSLRGFVEGSADKLLEKESTGALNGEQISTIRAWAKRWQLVFVRKSAVEESIIGEDAIEARLKFLESQPDEAPKATEGDATNGTAEQNGDEQML